MKNWNRSLAAVAALVIVAGFCQAGEISPPSEPMSVWFVSPARSFHESCPLGNGRLGAMDFGGVGRERIVLNESSLWSGGPYDGNKYDAYQCLLEVREKLFAGDISGASAALSKGFRYADGVSGWGDANQFGCYQTLGDLIVDFDNSPEAKLSSPSGHEAALWSGCSVSGYVSTAESKRLGVSHRVLPSPSRRPGCFFLGAHRSRNGSRPRAESRTAEAQIAARNHPQAPI